VNTDAHSRIAQIIARAWGRLGIQIDMIRMDTAQYTKALTEHAYDLCLWTWRHSLSPGVEQALYYHSKSIANPENRNYACIQNPNIDFICEQLLLCKTRSALEDHLRILDRLLRIHSYVIPLFHQGVDYFLINQRLGHPPYTAHSPYYPSSESFWIKGNTAP
jgi:ABC-type oligopeptide transport system substrate-binding subunit